MRINAFNCFCGIERNRFEMARKSGFSATSLNFTPGLGIPFLMAAHAKKRIGDVIEEQKRRRKGGRMTLMTIGGSTDAGPFVAALIPPD